MSESDSESVRGGEPGRVTKNLESAGRELVHDVATPLATLQLNLQVLSNYLPRLMQHCGDTAGTELEMSADRLKALASLPGALDEDIRKIRHAVQLFSAVLVPMNAPQASPSEGTPHLIPPQMCILLVEDEVIHQEITLKQLAGRCHVDVAATASDALRLASTKTYDLVLLDLMLSGQDARSLAMDLRSVSGKSPRIILVSNMPLATEEVQQLKADGALEKPFRFASLEILLATKNSATA